MYIILQYIYDDEMLYIFKKASKTTIRIQMQFLQYQLLKLNICKKKLQHRDDGFELKRTIKIFWIKITANYSYICYYL